jgi:methylmalonyl-CoA mutase, C-terminal domain
VTVQRRPIRVVLAKVGLDGHDRGVKVVARALRDAGMEVIYTGLHRTPEEVVAAAVQEDADFLGISILSGAHFTIFPRIIHLMREQQAEDIVIFGGGVMPDEDATALRTQGVAEDATALRTQGVAEIFLQDTPTEATVEWIVREFESRKGAGAAS